MSVALGLSLVIAMPASADLQVKSAAVTMRGLKEATLEVRVLMPAGVTSADALVIVNSSSGRDDVVMQQLAVEANRRGLAAVMIDTYTARGIIDTISNQEQVSYVQQFADIFAVLDVMRKDPRFAGRKIALSGHSRGGILTYMAAHRAFAGFYEADPPLFDAFVALSPDCLPTFQSKLLNGPLLMISGARDDWTRPAPCLRHVAEMKAEGQRAEMILIPNANHSFSSDGHYLGGAIKFACPLDRDYYYVRREHYGRPMFLRDSAKAEVETPGQMWRRCAGPLGFNGRGATGGGNRDGLSAATSAAIEFLKNMGW